MQISTKFRRVFPVFGDIFQIPVMLLFFFRFRCHFLFWQPTQPDRCSPLPEIDSTDFSDGQFWVPPPLHPMPLGRVRVGSKTDPAQPVDNPRCMHKLTKGNIPDEQSSFIKTTIEWFRTPPLEY